MSLLIPLGSGPASPIDISPGVASASREFQINVQNTLAFIAADPSTIRIQRDIETGDDAGGKVKVGNPINAYPEVVRMVPQGADNATSNPITQTTNGSLDRPDFVLVGEPGLQLLRGDYFEWRGDTWRILSVRPSPAYETKADVAVRKDG